jgi:uncharacterized OB-fold protein
MSTAIMPMPLIRRAGNRPFPPRVSSFTRPFWDGLAEGRLRTSACGRCGRLSFPPKPVCRDCWSEAVVWRDLVPRGTLYSYTRVEVLPRAFVADGLTDIAIVDLVDGVRLMCRLVGDPSRYAIDGPLEGVVLVYGDGPLLAVRPVG